MKFYKKKKKKKKNEIRKKKKRFSVILTKSKNVQFSLLFSICSIGFYKASETFCGRQPL